METPVRFAGVLRWPLRPGLDGHGNILKILLRSHFLNTSNITVFCFLERSRILYAPHFSHRYFRGRLNRTLIAMATEVLNVPRS